MGVLNFWLRDCLQADKLPDGSGKPGEGTVALACAGLATNSRNWC
jgi:hypothetical protein